MQVTRIRARNKGCGDDLKASLARYLEIPSLASLASHERKQLAEKIEERRQ